MNEPAGYSCHSNFDQSSESEEDFHYVAPKRRKLQYRKCREYVPISRKSLTKMSSYLIA